MIDGNFFNKLVSIYPAVLFQPVFMLASQEYIARQVREDDRPFGGIQVIFCGLAFPSSLILFVKLVVCGDFFQLPPVAEKNSPILFAFQASAWSRCFGLPVTLHRVFRQDNQGEKDGI